MILYYVMLYCYVMLCYLLFGFAHYLMLTSCCIFLWLPIVVPILLMSYAFICLFLACWLHLAGRSIRTTIYALFFTILISTPELHLVNAPKYLLSDIVDSNKWNVSNWFSEKNLGIRQQIGKFKNVITWKIVFQQTDIQSVNLGRKCFPQRVLSEKFWLGSQVYNRCWMPMWFVIHSNL